MNILEPKIITPEDLLPGTSIPEIDATLGEIAWTAGDYVKGDERIWSGFTYECVQDIAGAPVSAYEPDDVRAAMYWKKNPEKPSNRWAACGDNYLFTRSRAQGELTFVVRAPFVDGVAIYGLVADSYELRVLGDDDVDLQPVRADELWKDPYDEEEYLFGDLQRADYITFKNLHMHPEAKLHITLRRAKPQDWVEVGYLSIGNWRVFYAPMRDVNGVRHGAEVATKDFSYTEDYSDGTYKEYPGRKARDIALSCVIDARDAPWAARLLNRINGKAVAMEVSALARHSHLATVGKITGTVRGRDWESAEIDVTVKGNV